MALAVLMVLTQVPLAAFAANDYVINSSESSDDYYNLITKTDWDIAPGITESEIVLNNDDGSRRQVLHIMEADMTNPYTKVIGSYAEMNTSKYQTATMDVQAAWVEDNWGLNVVGAMNTCLSWYSGYPADKVGMPLGFLMVDGEILWDACEGFPTVLVINKDFDDEGNARPTDIPKVEMVQIRTSDDLDGWEEQVIPCSSGFIVKDGVNLSSANHSDAAPRSVVGIKADGTVVIMENDGRQSPYSVGMSMYELAEVMLDLGCTYAVNCDGGGSSTFLSQRPGEELEVNNSPSDGGLRPTTQGILFISTAPSDGAFVRASVEAESQYYTPNSAVQFTAKGADLAGGAAEIPADAYWQLSDASTALGTIDQNGLFTSNGTAGAVTAQLACNGEVCGEFTVNIVVPDALVFSQSTLTVPNGQSTSFTVTAMYGLIEVTAKAADYTLALSSEDMGTLEGCVLTATEDTAVTGGFITATLTYDTSVTATMQVVYGKASEVIFDFENGFGDSWYVEQLQKRKNWSKTDKTSHYNIVVKDYAVNADTGMVHDGIGAGAVYSDNTYATLNWAGAAMYWANETVTYENVSSIGAWVYIPKDAVAFAVRFCLIGVKDGVETGIDAYPVTYGDSLYYEESGWHYCSVDVSAYDAIILYKAPTFAEVNNSNRYNGFRIELSCQLNGGSNGEYSWQTTPGVKSINTFYVDNLTIDYSEACDDREAPIFGEVAYVEPVTSEDKYLNNQRQEATVTNYSSIGFSVAVAEDTNKINATGLDASSAKAYIDGNEVPCTFNGKNIAVNSQNLTNGVHTVKITICDRAGNCASVIRKINVQADSNGCGIKVVPKVEMDMAFTGSQYWVNVVANQVENVDKVSLTLDLNNVNFWLPEHIETLYGFEVTYETDIAGENLLHLTITRTGDVEASGEAVLVSIPVQTWEWKEEDYPGYLPSAGGDNDLNGNGMYDPYEQWQEYVTTNMDIIVNPLAGKVEYLDGTEEWFSGNVIQVDTEQKIGTWWGCSAANKVYFEGKSSWHLHVAGEAQDKAATCTENGYIGRVFCVGCACVTEDKLGHVCDSHDGCGSVIDWGTVIPATGHSYDFNAEGLLACEGCGKLFSGEHTDGKTYIDGVIIADGWYEDTYYYVDGVKVTGQYPMDGTMYNFDENGVYMPNYSFTGFYHDGIGWMYFLGNFQKKGFVVIDGNTHYFDDTTGYAPVGSFTLGNGRVYKVEGEQGKVLGAWETVIVDGVERRRYYYSLRYYKNQWLEVEGETYYFNNDGYALIGKRAVARSGEYLGGYEFAMDGKLVGAIDGPFTDYENGYMYIAEDGVLACNKLVEHNGDYYFARSNHLLLTWGAYLTEEQTGGLLPAGEYQFGPDGKLIMQNGPVADAYNPSYWTFYVNGVRIYKEGLYEYKGDYYYVRSNGLLITWPTYVSEEKANGLLPAGEYTFGADGKLVMQNGPVADIYNPAYLTFYKDGVRVYEEGLYEYNGGYYYVRSNGLLITWPTYVSEDKANGLLPAGEYTFGADGKLVMQSGPAADVYNPNYLVFYIDGIRITKEGLYEYNGDYYYVRSNGLLQTWATYVSEDKTNGLLPAGYYSFGADGKLILRDGVCLDDYGKLCYYINGVQQYDTGLIYWEGNYYYVRANGLICTWAIYVSEDKANGLLPAGEYTFGEDGKMIENP